MGVCDDILKKDISPSCDDPVVQGLEQEGVIMNRADVDFAATLFNSTRKNVIETLAMKTGKKAYKVIVPGKAPFTGTTTALATGTYRNSFTNTLVLVILANDPDVCADIIDGLANGSYVGGWTVTLEEQKAPKSALFLYKTSYEATKTAINTLTAEPAE